MRTNLRKLAAIDIAFLGYKIIVAEYALGVILSTALGIFVLVRGRSLWQTVLGLYFLCLASNYVPMFLYAVTIGKAENARAELADELTDRRRAASRYRRLSLVLLIPLAAPILAVAQQRSKLH